MPDETLDRSSLERLVQALKQARVQKSLSVEEMSRLIKIRSYQIERLEKGDFEFLPPLYIYSHLKKYAEELGIGDNALLEACRKELGISAPSFSVPPTAQVVMDNPKEPAPRPKGKSRRWLIVVATVAAVILAALALFYYFGGF